MSDAIATINISNGTGDVSDLFVNLLTKKMLMYLRHRIFLIKLVRRDFDIEFIKPRQGRTVNVRKYNAFEVADFTDGNEFTTQELTPSLVPVTLNKHKIIPFSVSSLAELISDPQVTKDFFDHAVAPIVETIETDLFGLYTALTTNNYTAKGTNGELIANDLPNVRRKLIEAKAPRGDFNFLVSSWDASKLLQEEKFISAAWIADAGNTIRNAYLGTRMGFNMFESTLITRVDTTSIKYTYHNIAFHPDALVLATRPLGDDDGYFAKPGVTIATVADPESGLSFRLGISYNHKAFRWIVSVDILYGVKALREELAVDVDSYEVHS
jgi:hypothetical protein